MQHGGVQRGPAFHEFDVAVKMSGAVSRSKTALRETILKDRRNKPLPAMSLHHMSGRDGDKIIEPGSRYHPQLDPGYSHDRSLRSVSSMTYGLDDVHNVAPSYDQLRRSKSADAAYLTRSGDSDVNRSSESRRAVCLSKPSIQSIFDWQDVDPFVADRVISGSKHHSSKRAERESCDDVASDPESGPTSATAAVDSQERSVRALTPTPSVSALCGQHEDTEPWQLSPPHSYHGRSGSEIHEAPPQEEAIPGHNHDIVSAEQRQTSSYYHQGPEENGGRIPDMHINHDSVDSSRHIHPGTPPPQDWSDNRFPTSPHYGSGRLRVIQENYDGEHPRTDAGASEDRAEEDMEPMMHGNPNDKTVMSPTYCEKEKPERIDLGNVELVPLSMRENSTGIESNNESKTDSNRERKYRNAAMSSPTHEDMAVNDSEGSVPVSPMKGAPNQRDEASVHSMNMRENSDAGQDHAVEYPLGDPVSRDGEMDSGACYSPFFDHSHQDETPMPPPLELSDSAESQVERTDTRTQHRHSPAVASVTPDSSRSPTAQPTRDMRSMHPHHHENPPPPPPGYFQGPGMDHGGAHVHRMDMPPGPDGNPMVPHHMMHGQSMGHPSPFPPGPTYPSPGSNKRRFSEPALSGYYHMPPPHMAGGPPPPYWHHGPPMPGMCPTVPPPGMPPYSGCGQILDKDVLRGVTYRPSGKWQAQCYFAGRSRYIGVFGTREKAALAYQVARERLFSGVGGRGYGKRRKNNSDEDTDAKALEAKIVAARTAAQAAVNGIPG